MSLIEKINSQKIPEWIEFYIDIEKLLKISNSINSLFPNDPQNHPKRQNSGIFEELNESDLNPLNENLLKNNEQHEREQFLHKTKSLNEINFIYNDLYNKFLKQLNLEIEKFNYFTNLLQEKRHRKRFEEIIQQLNYLATNPALKIFEKQLNKSMKNIYRELSVFQKFIDTNIEIKNTVFAQFLQNVDKFKKYFPNELHSNEHKQKFEEINQNLILANEYNQNFMKEIEEKFLLFFSTFYIKQKKDPLNVLEKYLSREKVIQDKENKNKLIILLIIMFILGISCVVIYRFSNLDMDADPEFKSLFPIYRTFGILCLYLWTLGLNVWVWNNSNVNYKALFMFDKHYSTVTEIFIRSSVFSIIFFSTFLLYILTRTRISIYFNYNRNILIGVLPLISWVSLLCYFFWPFKMFNHSGRKYTMRLFNECIASILIPVHFRHIWFMDQLTSLIGPMRDMEHTLCYYSNYFNPFQVRDLFCNNNRIIYLVLAILPNFFRILQVARQIYDNEKVSPYIFNIGKYTFNIIVATFSFMTNFDRQYFIPWLISAFISGCYSSFWDIKMDFGYMESGSKNWPLRNMTLYKYKFLCIMAIPIDIVLRFLWMLSISPEIMNEIIWPEFLALILYTLEMLRRAQWNFIRVEFEDLELIKGHRISYYEELPLIKCPDGRFVTDEHNLLNILNIGKLDRVRLELRELFNELEKNDDDKSRDKMNSDQHLKEEIKYDNYIVFLMDDYFAKYKIRSDEIKVKF